MKFAGPNMTFLIRDSFVRLLAVSGAMFLVNIHHVVRIDFPTYPNELLWLESPLLHSSADLSLRPPSKYRPLPRRRSTTTVKAGDFIYYKDLGQSWDAAPIVIESHKLVFFTIPKVGCTVWKQLFRRMMGYSDWESQDERRGIPHNPATNGLQYLYDYNTTRATEIMTSPAWTRAIMVRDPKERFLSAFLDKSVRNYHQHIIGRCCPDGSCAEDAQTLSGFLHLIQRCDDDHWRPQDRRIDQKFWGYVDVVLHTESAANDTENLLRKVGAWERYGATGWGTDGNSSIFERKDSGGSHSNFAEWQVWKWYTPSSEQEVVSQYQADYDNPLFHFDSDRCYTCQE